MSSYLPNYGCLDTSLRIAPVDRLKTGCRIEHQQLGTVRRLENCLAIDMMVAARIMQLTWLWRTCPDLLALA